MRRGWVLGCTLYVAFFALTIGLRWRQLAQPYTDFTWLTAHSQIIVDNWLEHGFWNERGLSFWGPPDYFSIFSPNVALEFPPMMKFEICKTQICKSAHPLDLLSIGFCTSMVTRIFI